MVELMLPSLSTAVGAATVWRGLQIFFAVLNVAILIMASLFLIFHRGFSVEDGRQVIDYKDFVSILLTAIAVMIAILTIFIAAAAVWGFSALKDEACRVARSEANQVALRATIEFHTQTRSDTGADLGAAAGGDTQ